MGLITKVINWVMLNGATLLGLAQSIVKAVKELLTGVINLLSLVIPASAAQALVEKARDFMNVIDGWIEKLKSYLL